MLSNYITTYLMRSQGIIIRTLLFMTKQDFTTWKFFNIMRYWVIIMRTFLILRNQGITTWKFLEIMRYHEKVSNNVEPLLRDINQKLSYYEKVSHYVGIMTWHLTIMEKLTYHYDKTSHNLKCSRNDENLIIMTRHLVLMKN